VSKRGIIQLSEFDINQKIIESLSNVCTRSVLFSVKNESKDVTQIANELKISLSTVYKTLSTLEDLALAEVDRYVISPEGKKVKLYRSRIGNLYIPFYNCDQKILFKPHDSDSKMSN
jgi:DNA-binding transcriptional ArsR family regulator